MNKAVFALGAVLLVASVIVITYAAVVQFPYSQPDCHWTTSFYPPSIPAQPPTKSNPNPTPIPVPWTGYVCYTGIDNSDISFTFTMPRTSEPYLSYGVVLATVALVAIVIGYVIPKRTNQSGTALQTN